MFALGDGLPVLLAASVLSGLAGALFNPAVRAYLAQEAGERKAEAFALFNVFATTGALIGPLLGSALLLVDFRTSALTAAGIFAVLTIAQALVLPGARGRAQRERCPRGLARGTRQPGLPGLRPRHGRHVHPGEPALPAAARRGPPGHRLGRRRGHRLPRRHGGEPGVPAENHAQPQVPWQQGGLDSRRPRGDGPGLPAAGPGGGHGSAGWLDAIPVLLGALLLYLGVMVASPFVMELIPRFGRPELTGTYFGIFYVVSGIAAAVGNAVVGWAMDAGESGGRAWLPWVCCALFGLASAGGVAWLQRRGALPANPAAAAPVRDEERSNA
ncbi:MFS transporter [Streptomyces sp. MS1.AVA.1]|uniref:MFS transporter n=1 Tax=Streptomyces machairae TaxID=3134109 RepID=A0ABU8URP1_9ACTN